MAMLATMEGAEDIESEEYILGRMFSPNDGLGIELLGVEGWNAAKQKAANIAIDALRKRRLFIVPEILYCNQMDAPADLGTAKTLFGVDENYCIELLGANPFKAVAKGLKKAVSDVGKAITSAPSKVVNPVESARNFAKSQLKLVKKYTKPSQALKLTLSPTEQIKAISQSDVTGVSQAVTKQAAKISPDLMPYELTKQATKKAAYTSRPTRIAYKAGEKAVKTADIVSPGGAYEASQEAQPVVQYLYPGTGASSDGLPVETESAGFDWSSLINWKTLAIGGVAAWLIFGRRGSKRGR